MQEFDAVKKNKSMYNKREKKNVQEEQKHAQYTAAQKEQKHVQRATRS